MSIEEIKEVILTGPNMIPQIKGLSGTIVDILVTLDLSDVLDKEKATRFLINVLVTVDNETYSYSGIHSMSELSEEGMLAIGNICVKGPLMSPSITKQATIYYLNDV